MRAQSALKYRTGNVWVNLLFALSLSLIGASVFLVWGEAAECVQVAPLDARTAEK